MSHFGVEAVSISSLLAKNDKDGQVFMVRYYLAIIAQDWWLIERLIESAAKKHTRGSDEVIGYNRNEY